MRELTFGLSGHGPADTDSGVSLSRALPELMRIWPRSRQFGWPAILAAFFAAAIGAPASLAAPLKSATVQEIKGEVILKKEGDKERSAAVKDVLAGKDVVRTGKKSRAELEFADQSIARLGSNTIFSFDPESRDREMNVQRGTALIHVPPGRSGARISCPAATAAILGDVLAMRVDDQGGTQIVALSRDEAGPIQVTLNRTGETRTLEPGQMLTLTPGDVRLPEPVTISVDVFTQSSGLVNGFEGRLSESADTEISRARATQSQDIRRGLLQRGIQVRSSRESGGRNLEVRTTTVEAASGSSVAGRYVGNWKDQAPCTGGAKLGFEVREDGTFTAVFGGTGAGGNQTTVINGTINSDGSYTATTTDGKPSDGNVRFDSGSIEGIFSHGTCLTGFKASK